MIEGVTDVTDASDRPNVHNLDDLLDARKRLVATGSDGLAELDAQFRKFSRESRLMVLERRGEKRSLAQRGRVVGYSDRRYPVALGVVLAVLLVINLSSLAWGRWLAAIPVVIQSAIVIALLSRHPSQVILVRIWACVIGVAGATGLVGFAAGILADALATSESDVSYQRPLYWFPVFVIELTAAVWFYRNASQLTTFEHAEDEPIYADAP